MDYQAVAENLFSSLARVLAGVSGGVLFGLSLAGVRRALPRAMRENFLLALLFEFPRFPPPIAWLPFVILYFGIGQLSTVVVVFLAAFPVMMTAAYESLQQIPEEIHWITGSLDLPPLQKVFRIYIPFIAPALFTGGRLALGMGWMSVIAAEMIGGSAGLGYSIQMNRLNLRYESMLLDIFLIGLVGFVFHKGFLCLEALLLPWAPGRRRNS